MSIMTYWIADIKKIQERLERIRGLASKFQEPIKSDLLLDIDIIQKMTMKGKIKRG